MKVDKYACFAVILKENWFRLVYTSIIFTFVVMILAPTPWLIRFIPGLIMGYDLSNTVENFTHKYGLKLSMWVELFLFFGLLFAFLNMHLWGLAVIHWSLGLL